MKKVLFILAIVIVTITMVLSIALGCYYTDKENSNKTDVVILKELYGAEISDVGLETYTQYDNLWKYDYPGQIHIAAVLPSDAYEYDVISPSIKEKLEENIPNLYYWVEFTCVKWEITEKQKAQLTEDLIKDIEDTYGICMAYHKAGLLPQGRTQIVYGEDEDANNPERIIGLWNRQEIDYFAAHYEEAFNGLYGYISLHFFMQGEPSMW